MVINRQRALPEMDRRLFGSFLEHLGRAIYTGIYEPGSKLADANGFRRDVIQEVKQLGVPIVRYPGGNFVSGYNWLDGVGPKDKRPTVLDRAWDSIETNQVGTNEFIDWCKLVNTEPLLACNLGTGTPATASAYVEYCNVAGGTRWSDLRREHGYEIGSRIALCCDARPTDAMIYTMLTELAAGGYVEFEAVVISGRTRKIYALAETGDEAYQAAAQAWSMVLPQVGLAVKQAGRKAACCTPSSVGVKPVDSSIFGD